MVTTRTERTPANTTRTEGKRVRKYKDYLRWTIDSGIVNVLDHLNRKIVIFSNIWFEEVSSTIWTERTPV